LRTYDTVQAIAGDLATQSNRNGTLQMRILTALLCLGAAALPAAAQTHPRHTAAHDSAHAIQLDDAQHLALHEFLLGHWVGVATHGARADTMHVRFENDSLHQQLMTRQASGVAGFEIRRDTLRWQQEMKGSACTAETPVSELLQAAQSKTRSPQIQATLTCGSRRTPIVLRKGS
jgi:hypothetical protein